MQLAVIVALLVPALAAAYLSTGATADRSWFWQNQVPQGNPLRGMSWSDASNGWAVGVGGTLLRTSDGGLTWSAQDPQTKNDLTGVSFVSSTTGWTVGISGTIKKTVDGGANWTNQTSGTAANFRGVSFANGSVGVAVGDAGSSTATIRYTTDGGTTWRGAATTSTVGLSGVEMVSATVGWAVGGSGAVLKTTDGGATWIVRPSPTTAGLSAIAFAPGGVVGYFVGNAALPNWTCYKTTDSGATWVSVAGLGVTGAVNLTGVDALDANNAVVVGVNGAIRRTIDAGATWTNQSQNNVGSTALRAVKMFDSTHTYAIGDIGMMFYARNGGDSWFTLLQGSLATWYAVDFSDVDHGWAVGTNGAIMRTADAGQTWEQQAAGIVSWRAVAFSGSSNGWVVGDGGAIKHTNNGIDWVAQTSTTTNQLNGLWFTSATTGFAVGNTGTILKTIDGGTTWVAKPSGTVQNLNAVWFADANTGYAVGATGTIRKSINAGETWSSSASGGQALLSVRGVSASVVWVSGNNGTMRTTINGGTSWTTQTTGAGTNPVRTVFPISTTTGWLGSSFGIVQKSTDSGVTWVSQVAGMPTSTLDPATGVYGSWFSGNTGYLVGDSGTVRRTIDGGTTWTSLQYGTLSTLNSVMFTDAANGWASGTGGTMMRTADGGQTWTQQKTGSTVSLNQVLMSDALNGWTAGDNGTVRRTVNGGLTWLAQTSGVTVNLAAIGSGDPSRAIIAGTGALKFTTTAGSTWTTASTLPTQPVTGLYMVDAEKAWAVTTRVSGNNAVWVTANHGINWTSQSTTANANLWDVYFRDANTGYAVGDSGVILKTTNGGALWTRKSTPTSSPLYWIRFADANTGWAVGGGGIAVRTIDGGETWTMRDAGTNQALSSIAFSGTSRGWIVGVNGTILQNNNLVPPTTTMTVNPVSPNGASGWYKGAAPMITATSTVGATTYYGWTSAAGPFSAYVAPFSAMEGTQTLYYYSVNVGSDAETVRSISLKTDASNPTAPASVGVSAVTTSSALVTWTAGTDAVSGVARYEVYVDGAYYGNSITGSLSVAGLSPYTLYSITVRTVDTAGNSSSDSAPATALLTSALETAPYTTLLTTAPFTANGLGGWFVNATPTISLASFPPDTGGLPRTTRYSWTSVSGPWTDYATALTPPGPVSTLYYWTKDTGTGRADELVRSHLFLVDTQTPPAPTVIGAATSYQSINASWTPVVATPSGIARYDVFVDGALYASVTSPLVDIVGLHKATPYAIRVMTVNSAGATSTLSATVTVTTDNSPLPTAPDAVYAKAPTGDSVYIDWTATTDSVGTASYRIWRSEDGATFSAIATTTGGVLDCSYIDTGRRSSTRYWYAISTVDSRGESPTTSNTLAAVWPYIAPVTYRPPRPLGITATPILGGVFVQWAASSNPAIMGYIVNRGPASLAATSTITTLTVIPITNLGYIDWAVNDGEPYFYSVTAIDASGTLSSPSVEALARSIVAIPGANAQPHEFGSAASGCICHATHVAAGVDTLIRFPDVGKQTMCPTCHAPASSYQQFLDPLLKSKHSEGATPTVDQPFVCITCHVPLHKTGTPAANLMRTNGSSPCVLTTDTPAGNSFCYKCHGPGSTLPMGDLTAFEASGHRNIPPPPTGAGIVCDTCHESHSSRNTGLLKYEGYMVCMQCHTASASNPDETDIYTKLTLNEASNSKHPLLPQDQVTGARMTCQNCHNTHATTKTLPLVDPHNPSPAGAWLQPRLDEKGFCFRCHNGQALPTAAETAPWAGAVLARNAATTTLDVQTLYQTNVHGFDQRSDSTTTNAYLRPDMGYKYGDVLECRVCHDPHGTANGDAIQTEIVSASGDKTIHGVLTARVGGGVKDFRFFCNTCHVWDSASHDARASAITATTVDTTVFPTNCAACHIHAKGNLANGSPLVGGF